MAVKTNAKTAQQAEPAADTAMAEAAGGAAEQAVTPIPEGNGISEHPAPAEGSGLYELKPVCTIDPEATALIVTVFEAVASLIAGAGFLIRQGGEQAAPFGKDILAASFRRDGGITAATADGRKFLLKNGEVHEA